MSIKDGRLRNSIMSATLTLKVIIPSIRSFHQNLKYLHNGAHIMKSLLLGGRVRKTLFQDLSERWTQPEYLEVEVDEGRFEALHTPTESPDVHIAYKQLFLFALRHFPWLSRVSPRKDNRRADVITVRARRTRRVGHYVRAKRFD